MLNGKLHFFCGVTVLKILISPVMDTLQSPNLISRYSFERERERERERGVHQTSLALHKKMAFPIKDYFIFCAVSSGIRTVYFYVVILVFTLL